MTNWSWGDSFSQINFRRLAIWSPQKTIQSSWFVLIAYSLLTSTLTVNSPTADVSSRAAGEEEEVVGVDGGVSPSGPPPWEEEVVPPEDDVVEDSLDERRRLLQEF